MNVLEEATTEGVASASDEVPVYIPAGDEHVFAIVTWPVTQFNGTAVMCLHAGAQNLTSHRGGTYTKLCRRISGQGYLALRMDFHGSGDSSGVLADRDVEGQTSDDVDAAVQWLLRQGAERIVVVGTCWGGLVALTVAARFDEIVSTCLVSPPLRLIESRGGVITKDRRKKRPLGRAVAHFGRPRVVKLLFRERDYRLWVLGRARRRLQTFTTTALGRVEEPKVDGTVPRNARNSAALLAPLLRRGVPVHVLVGKDDRTYHDLTTPGALPALERAAAILDVVAAPVSVHGLSTLQAQETVINQVQMWLAQDLTVIASRQSA